MATTPFTQRQTRQRNAIFQVIQDASGPLPAAEIHRRAGEKLPRVGRATVYRALKVLQQEGQVQAVNLPSGERRYGTARPGPHDLFQCRECEQVFDLSPCRLQLKADDALPKGFQIESHEMTLYGLCAGCASHSSPSS